MSSMKKAVMKLGKTPRPAAWSPPLASFPPPALVLTTSSSNSLPHLAAAVFWWPAEVEAINRRTPRAKRAPNWSRRGLGRSAQVGRPRPVSAQFSSGFSPVASRVIPY
jgi:hypothetical protein